MKGGGSKTAAIRSSGSRSGLDGLAIIPNGGLPPHMAKVSGNVSRQKKMSKKQVNETIKRFQTTIGNNKSGA